MLGTTRLRPLVRALCAMALIPLSAAANSSTTYSGSLRYSGSSGALFDYSFVQGSALLRDEDHSDLGGGELSAGFGFASNFAAIGSFEKFKGRDEEAVGPQFHATLTSGLDGVLSAQGLRESSDDHSHLGLRADAGLRWLALPSRFELDPEAEFERIAGHDRTTIGANAFVRLVARLDLEGGASFGEGASYRLGLRYVFGPGYNLR